MTILIVDDNATSLALLREQLESAHYTVLEASNGLEALEVTKKEHVDLVISDILMPRMDGYRLCHQLRLDVRLKDLPFIFYTGTYTSPSDEKFALELGADKFMEKTASTELLLAVVREVLERPVLKRGTIRKFGEGEILHEYSERLVAKLKDKNDELTRWAAEIRKLSSAVEQSADSIVITDKEGFIRFVNSAFEKVTGFTREEVLGKTPRILRSGKHGKEFYESLWGTILSGKTFRETFINKKKSGEFYYDEQSITPVLDEDGAITHFVSTGRDITEQKRAEEALRESENRYRMLFDANPLPLWVFEVETLRFLAVNEAAITHYGYSREEFLSMVITQIRPEEDVARVVEDVAKTREGEISRGIWRHRKKDGTVIDVEVSAHDFIFSGRKARLVLANDVTERRRAQQALLESEERYRQLTDTIKEVFWMTNVLKNEMVYISKGYEDIWGRTRKSLYQNPRSWMESLHQEDRDRVVNDAMPKQVLGTYDEEYRIVRPDGSIRWIHDKAFPVLNDQGIVYRVVGVAEDITDRKAAEQAFELQKKYFEQLFQSSPQGIVFLNARDHVIDVNRSFERIFQYSVEELMGCSLNDFIVPVEHTQEAQRLSMESLEGNIVQAESVRKRKDGSLVHVSITGYPIVIAGRRAGVYGIYEDITREKELEAELRQAQKLESIGTLAGGVAHDFNNILGIILGYASILQRDDVAPETIHQVVKPITEAVQRGAGLVRQLLTFARKTGVTIDPVNVNSIVQELSSMVRATFPKTIEILVETDDDLPILMADQSQLHQTLLNLCVNARDAMPSGGTITVRTSQVDGPSVRRRFPDAREERYVGVDVGDTGTGMDEATRSRIFEPFFTTKELGKGTGLGLSVVYGVIKSLNGFIDVESEIGKGSTFHLYLPVPQRDHQLPTWSRPSDEPVRGGSESILLVEDEESMHALVKSFLEMNGYTVLSAFNGLEAVELFAQHQKTIDLVLSDMGLPKLTGLEAVKQMKSLRGDLKVILASGFVDPGQQGEIEKAGIKIVFQKPYNPVAILKSIRDLLDKS